LAGQLEIGFQHARLAIGFLLGFQVPDVADVTDQSERHRDVVVAPVVAGIGLERVPARSVVGIVVVVSYVVVRLRQLGVNLIGSPMTPILRSGRSWRRAWA
jgi:hypothetical protein